MTGRCLNRLNRQIVASYFVSLIALFVGCQSKPPMAPASGTVTVAGKPLTAGRILFEPVGGGADAMPALGDIQSDGSFQLYTFKPGDGVMPGTYYPVVMDPKGDDGAEVKNARKIGVVQLPKTLCEVKLDGANSFEIEISKEDLKWAVDDD